MLFRSVGTHGGALLPERAPGACSGRVNFLTASAADGFLLRHTQVMKFSYCLFAIAERGDCNSEKITIVTSASGPYLFHSFHR